MKGASDAGSTPAWSTMRMFMKALKSKLAEHILKAGVKIPCKEGAKFVFEGREYTVRYFPKAS